MKAEKYISARQGVNGFSFANLGLFTGFGDGIISAVYSLILLEIWKSPDLVGIYSAAYYGFGLLVQIFFGEAMRFFSKAKLFYFAMSSVVVCYILLSFSVKPMTFLALDFFTEIPLVFIMTILPLFMADFAGRGGIAKMNGRYHFWLNVGALLAPPIAMFVAGIFGNRSAFAASAAMYLLGFLIFKKYKIVQDDKAIHKISPRRTLKSIWRSTLAYFGRWEFRRAYFINFGYYAMKILRLIYWPILVIEGGFSKTDLGLILSVGVLPYVLLSEPVGSLARKFGKKATTAMFAFAVILFIFCSFAMWFASGWTMLGIFMLIQASGAIQEALHDMVFFDVANRAEQGRFYGIFNTSTNLPKFIIPLIGAGFIWAFGATKAIWLATGIFGIITTLILLSHKK